jgi:methylmalonyl-CoA mutase, N-terminal domain
MGQAIADGWVQGQIEDAAYRYQTEIEKGERLIVGLNHASTAEIAPPAGFTLSPEAEARQRSALVEIKATRDVHRLNSSLGQLARAAESRQNLMPFLLDAVRAYATIGEISRVLRDQFGVYQPRF